MSGTDMENILKQENLEGTDRKRKGGELLGGTAPQQGKQPKNVLVKKIQFSDKN